MLEPSSAGIAVAKLVSNEIRNEDTSCESKNFASKVIAALALPAVVPFVPGLPEALSGLSNGRELALFPLTNQNAGQLLNIVGLPTISAPNTIAEPLSGLDPRKVAGDLPDALNRTLDQSIAPDTLSQQIARNQNEVELGRKPLDSRTEMLGDGIKTTSYNELTLADARYLGYGHTVDFFRAILEGNAPSLHLCMMTLVDMTDLATAGAMKDYLAKYKLMGHTYKVIERIEITDTYSVSKDSPKPSSAKTNKGVEEKSQRGPNLRTETNEEKLRKEVTETETRTKQVVVSRAQLPSLGENPTSLDYAQKGTQTGESADAKLDRLKYAEMEKEAFIDISKRHIVDESSLVKQKESYALFGLDTSSLFGAKERILNQSPVQQTKSVEEEHYRSSTHSADEILALRNTGKLDEAADTISQEKHESSTITEAKNVGVAPESSGAVEFKEGLIGLLPGGSIVNLAMKGAMGAEITKSDMFWAAFDAAAAAATLGGGALLTSAARGGLKAVGKEVAEGVAERAVKEGAEAAGKSAAKKGVQAGLKESAETAGERATRSSAQQVAMRGGKDALDPTEALKPGTRNISGKLDEDVMDTVPKRNTGTIDQADGLDTVKAGPKASSDKLVNDVPGVDGPGTSSIRNAPDSAVKKIGDKTLTKTEPNAIYETKNGMRFRTDHLGRPKEAVGRLQADAVKGNPHTQKLAREKGLPGDDGGHLIPKGAGGPGDLCNIVPQASDINRGAVKKIENELRKMVSEGKTVDYNVKVNYPHGVTDRPSSFSITAHVDGKFYKEFKIRN